MASLVPEIEVLAGSIPAQMGFMQQAGLMWWTPAEAWNMEAGTQIDGRYNSSKGHVQSAATPLRQDTFIHGSTRSAGYVGRSFDIVSGSWIDDVTNASYGVYGISNQNGASSGTVGEIVSHDTTSNIEDCAIILRRGFPPPEALSSQVAHQRSTCFTYVQLAYKSPDMLDYRLAIEYGQPFRLDVSYDGGTTWQQVAIARDLGDSNRYFDNNNHEVRFHVQLSIDHKTIGVEIGDGNWLTHCPDPKQMQQPDDSSGSRFDISPPATPSTGNIRITHQNGTLSFWYLPFRYPAISVVKSSRDMGRQIQNADQAVLLYNNLAPDNPDQTTTPTVTTDGQTFNWQLDAETEDAGEGLGGSSPALLSDAVLYLPAIYDNTIPGVPSDYLAGVSTLRVTRLEEVETFDDVTRTATTRAVITVNNWDDLYSGSYGNFAINIATSNGNGPLVQRWSGITDQDAGMKFMRQDPSRLLTIVANGKEQLLKVPLGDECNFDGNCLYSVVKFLCADKGNIHPQWLQTIPDWPLGPAGPDCPYPVLPSGFGLQPRFKFLPNQIIWDILQLLCQDSGDFTTDVPEIITQNFPIPVLPVPFYMGFTSDGQFHFEPVALWTNEVTGVYSESDPTGFGQILEMEVVNSVADMRTELNFQGLDALTYELLYFHLDLPPWTLVVKGYRDSWIERNARYASEDYIQFATYCAAIQSSIPQQVVVIKVPHDPTIHAGTNVMIYESRLLGGGGMYNVKSVRNVLGLSDGGATGAGEQEAYMILTTRNVINTL